MIRTINEWKNNISNINKNSKILNINKNSSCNNEEFYNNISKCAEYVRDLGVSKSDAIKLIENVFINPINTPDSLSANFISENVNSIIDYIDNVLPDADFSSINKDMLSVDILNNDQKFECVMFIENNDKIAQLTKSLNINIKKNNFKAIYENNIFFINSLDNLNESNRNIVLNILQEVNAKNISEQIKWIRKIK